MPGLSIVKSEPLAVTSSQPLGNDRTRTDTNMIGIDHDAIIHGISNWASTLSPQWQKPAAFLATLPADALASLVEMFSSPEGVATMGAKPAMAALDGAGAAARNGAAATVKGAVRTVAGAGDVVHPDVISMVSPRAGKAVEMAQRVRGAMRKPVTAASAELPVAAPVEPVASPVAAPASPAASAMRTGPAESSAESAPSAPKNSLPDQKALNEEALARRRAEYQARLKAEAETPAAPAKVKLTATEQPEYVRLLSKGMNHQQAMDLIAAQREIQARFGLSTPTRAETKFPKGQRGKYVPPADR